MLACGSLWPAAPLWSGPWAGGLRAAAHALRPPRRHAVRRLADLAVL